MEDEKGMKAFEPGSESDERRNRYGYRFLAVNSRLMFTTHSRVMFTRHRRAYVYHP
jgi:hypothetical protein